MGVSLFILSVMIYWYYNTVMAWTLYFLVSSFQSELPWSLCGQWWNTPSCVGRFNTETMTSPNATSSFSNVTNVDGDYFMPFSAWLNTPDGTLFRIMIPELMTQVMRKW